jgi:hypothetical protein
MHVASFAWAAALLAGVLTGSVRAAEPPSDTAAMRTAIETCRTRIDAQIDVGYERIAARCPELMRALASGEWEDWLPRNWREPGNDLSIGGLQELAILIERERARERTGRRPGTAKLHAVLEDLQTAQSQSRGPWERFRSWFESVFSQPGDDADSAWLERVLERAAPSQIVIETVTYLAIALIVALAASIVVNELLAAAALRRSRTRSKASSMAPVSADEPLTWRRVEEAIPQDRPSLLLRLVLERLAKTGRLPPAAASLTVREAQELATIADAEDRARLAELSAAAEQVRYAPRPASPGMLAHALEAGAALLASLETVGARPS